MKPPSPAVGLFLALLSSTGRIVVGGHPEVEIDSIIKVKSPCLHDQFHCDAFRGVGKCILKKWVCDKEPDCEGKLKF